MLRAILVGESEFAKRKFVLYYSSLSEAIDTMAVSKMLDGIIGWDLKGLGVINPTGDPKRSV